MTMTPWPRRLVNFPIILIAITQQYIWATMLLLNHETMNITAIDVMAKLLPPIVIAIILICVATLAIFSFSFKRRMLNLLGLLPQQFMLFLSAGGALQAMLLGRFADGIERSHAFLVADQCSAILIALFHTWAIFLILRYGAD